MIAVLIVVVPALVLGQSKKVASESNLKAVYVYSFGRYVSWPADAFESAESDIVIGIIGNSAVAEKLERVAAKRKIQNRSIQLKRFVIGSTLPECHILFLAPEMLPEEEQAIIEQVRGRPVLLVGESPAFLANGGMMQFFVDGTVRFEINVDATKSANLTVNAKLLRLSTKRSSP